MKREGKDTDRKVDFIMFGGEKVEKCIDCGEPLVETDEKGLYACSDCGVQFYGDDHKSPIFI